MYWNHSVHVHSPPVTLSVHFWQINLKKKVDLPRRVSHNSQLCKILRAVFTAILSRKTEINKFNCFRVCALRWTWPRIFMGLVHQGLSAAGWFSKFANITIAICSRRSISLHWAAVCLSKMTLYADPSKCQWCNQGPLAAVAISMTRNREHRCSIVFASAISRWWSRV